MEHPPTHSTGWLRVLKDSPFFLLKKRPRSICCMSFAGNFSSHRTRLDIVLMWAHTIPDCLGANRELASPSFPPYVSILKCRLIIFKSSGKPTSTHTKKAENILHAWTTLKFILQRWKVRSNGKYFEEKIHLISRCPMERDARRQFRGSASPQIACKTSKPSIDLYKDRQSRAQEVAASRRSRFQLVIT